MAKASARRMSGDGGLYQRADGMWMASLDRGWKADGKRDRWVGGSMDKNKALEKLREARKEMADYGTVGSKRLSVGQWLDRWLIEIAKPSVKPKTYVDYERVVRLHLKPRIGRERLHSLNPGQVRQMEQAIAKAKSAATARSAHRVLSVALSEAAREGLVARNVAQLVSPPRSVVVERQALTVEEAQKLIARTSGDPLGSRWAFALLTGTRQGEGIGLEWDRVDLKNGTVDISWQLQRLPFAHGCDGACGRKRGGSCPQRVLDVPAGFEHRVVEGGLVLTRPKTNKGTRIIPLPPMLITALKTHRKSSLTKGLVWTREDGGPIDPKDDALAWDAALKAASVRDVPLHSARHTTATLLMELGVDVTIVQAIMGHTKATTTQNYQHASVEMARQALDGLGDALAT